MPKQRSTPEECLQSLRTVELETGKGVAVLDACRKIYVEEVQRLLEGAEDAVTQI